MSQKEEQSVWEDEYDKNLMLCVFAEVMVDEMIDDEVNPTKPAAQRLIMLVASRRLKEFEQRMLRS